MTVKTVFCHNCKEPVYTTNDEWHVLGVPTRIGREIIKWRGVIAQKSPCDLQTYAEIIWDTRPDLIIQTGTWHGGSALFLADMLSVTGNPKAGVLSIDIEKPPDGHPEHPRVTYIYGDSKNVTISISNEVNRIMVVLDSDHSYDHVLAECRRFGPLVTPGCYMVVEDTDDWPAGDACRDYVKESMFEHDHTREFYGYTHHPGGFLLKS